MKDSEDSIWTRKTHRTFLDDAEDLAYEPTGGPIKQWITGFIIASLPIIYGIHCIQRGYATLFGNHGSNIKLMGDAGLSLAIAYIAIGGFIHFHYFWGLSDRLWRFSKALKVTALMVFLLSFLYALYLAIL
jgi:hypothetical protein